MKVGKVVSRIPMYINENATVLDAVKMMSENKLYGLVVKNDANEPVGLVSERSVILRFVLRDKPARDVQVKTIMRSPIPSVKEEDDVKDVSKFLSDNALTRCGVLDKNKKLVGIITITDLARYLSVQSISDVLVSHRNRKYKYICKVCLEGTMEPVFNGAGEITVFKCSNEKCGHIE